MVARVTPDAIWNASALFWEPMLGMCVDPFPYSLEASERCIGAGHVFGKCEISGAWTGAIEVRLTTDFGRLAAAAMLMQPADAVSDDDMLDAVREIANMIAGTIKSTLPRPCRLSVPSAEIEADDFCALPRTEESVSVFFGHPAGELMVRVHEYGTGQFRADPAVAALCA